MSEWIGTKDAMKILGVGSTTIKRWADCDVLPFIRTAGGHRRFRRSVVQQLRRPHRKQSTDAAAAYRWVRKLRTQNTACVKNQIAELYTELGNWFAVADFLGAVTLELGECWEDDEFSIVDEHIASARLRQALTNSADAFPLPEGASACLLATLEGERHELGLALAELCLRSRGIETLWAGTDLPVTELLLHLRNSETSLRIVALSASVWRSDAIGLTRAYLDIASVCRERGIDLVIGGSGAWPDELTYGFRCHSFVELKRVLGEIGE